MSGKAIENRLPSLALLLDGSVDFEVAALHGINVSNNSGIVVATMNFNVPKEVKQAFEQTFEGHDKSTFLTGLMREAIVSVERQRRRAEAARKIIEDRETSEPISASRLAKTRRAGRP